MAAVTIGVPVYNGAQQLDECLACLAGQTFPDFEVLIYDNASTDATAAIAEAWAKKDQRFRYFRQPQNCGALQNFHDVLKAAASEYFMWRAHDDISAANFVEVTHRLLASHPRAKLAVGRVQKRGEGTSQDSDVPNMVGGPRLLRVRRALRAYRPSWFYGLWRRQAAVEAFDIVSRGNPREWGFDHMTLFLLAVNDAIVGSNATYFVKRKRKANAPPSEMQRGQLHAVFAEQCQKMLERQPMSSLEHAVLRVITRRYARRLFKARKFEAWTSTAGAANGE